MVKNPTYPTGIINGHVVAPARAVPAAAEPPPVWPGLRAVTTPRDRDTLAPMPTIDGLTGIVFFHGHPLGMYLHMVQFLTWAWDRSQPNPVGPPSFSSRSDKTIALMKVLRETYFPTRPEWREAMAAAWQSDDGWRKGVDLFSMPADDSPYADVASAVATAVAAGTRCAGDPEPYARYVGHKRGAGVWAKRKWLETELAGRYPALWAVIKSAMAVDAHAALGYLVMLVKRPAGTDADRDTARRAGMAIASGGSILAGPNPTPGVSGVSGKLSNCGLKKAQMAAALLNATAAVIGLHAEPGWLWGVLGTAAAMLREHLSNQPHAVIKTFLGKGGARRLHDVGVAVDPRRRNRTDAVYPPSAPPPGRALGPVALLLKALPGNRTVVTTREALAGVRLLKEQELEVAVKLALAAPAEPTLTALTTGPLCAAITVTATVADPVPMGALAWLRARGVTHLTVAVRLAEAGAVGGVVGVALRAVLPNVTVDRTGVTGVIALNDQGTPAEVAALGTVVGRIASNPQARGPFNAELAASLAAAATALGHQAQPPVDPAILDALCTAASDLPPAKRAKTSQ
jgi:hypothetical protein